MNNIPADVLVSMGCNFVIAVSVTAKMEKEFCDITPDEPTRRGKKPGVVQTLLRSLLVQNHSLNAFGVQPADVVIEPDVTGFDLTEFMRAKELAAIGEAAALEQIPKIRQLLTRLDPQLFPPTTAPGNGRGDPRVSVTHRELPAPWGWPISAEHGPRLRARRNPEFVPGERGLGGADDHGRPPDAGGSEV